MCSSDLTCDVDVFVRQWYEVDTDTIGFTVKNCYGTFSHKWFPYSKGGEFRRWYGNKSYIVLWENNGEILRNLRDEIGRIKSRPQNIDNYFTPIITWSAISSSKPSMRMIENSIYGGGGTGYITDTSRLYMLAFLNSKIALEYLSAISPTLNYEAGHIMSLPLKYATEKENQINNIISNNLYLSCLDWDAFETSWDFKRHPML